MRFVPMTPEQRPQDDTLDGDGWTFETAEHGGDLPDQMPQAVIATDPEGRRCVYVALKVDGVIGTFSDAA